MANILLRQKTIDLRKQGKTYSEIKRRLNIPKSTLSDWLSKYPLTQEQLRAIEKSSQKNKEIGIEKCRLTKQRKREERLKKTYRDERGNLLPLTEKEIYLVGLFLYWGEGFKNLKGAISLSNTDPKVIKFFLFWLTKGLKISINKIKVHLHLYDDMNREEMLNFWSKELGIPKSQFSKPYIKKSKRVNIDQKGFGYGTCNLVVCDTRLKEKIMMGIQAIADYYTDLIS